MRSRPVPPEQVAAVARRRLEQLTAELATTRDAVRPRAPDVASAPVEAPADARGAADSPDWGGGTTPFRPGAPDPWRELLADERGRTSGAPPPPGRHARRAVGRTGLVGGWVHDRLPPSIQGRVRIGAQHLVVVALLLAAAMAATSWWVVRADRAGVTAPVAGTRGDGEPPAPLVDLPAATDAAAPPATSGAPAGATSTTAGTSTGTGAGPGGAITGGAPSAPAAGVVVVDVVGKVRHPGIQVLPVGARVVDAIAAAGGLRAGARTGGVNQARLLVDGEQIAVGTRVPVGVAAAAASVPGAGAASGALVNLNTADQATLETLPSVGPVTAQAILQWRTENGGFTSVEELLEVSGIGDATLAEIAPHATV